MQRDMELIRHILVAIEEREDVAPKLVELDDYDDEAVARHVELLHDAGFIDGLKSAEISRRVPRILVRDLTWEGHEFASALQRPNVWDQMKRSFSSEELGKLPLGVMKDVGIGLLKKWAMGKAGLSD